VLTLTVGAVGNCKRGRESSQAVVNRHAQIVVVSSLPMVAPLNLHSGSNHPPLCNHTTARVTASPGSAMISSGSIGPA
jgi:hypothetical protein